MNETRSFPAVCKTYSKETALILCVTFLPVNSGPATVWPMLWDWGYGDDLADPASQTSFGGCHLVKHVGKHGLLNMPTLHLHPSSPWWSVCYHESTCCFTGFEFVCSLLVNFMSRLYQKCSPKALALHSKLCRQIFCLADGWYWGEKWGSWDKCN